MNMHSIISYRNCDYSTSVPTAGRDQFPQPRQILGLPTQRVPSVGDNTNTQISKPKLKHCLTVSHITPGTMIMYAKDQTASRTHTAGASSSEDFGRIFVLMYANVY